MSRVWVIIFTAFILHISLKYAIVFTRYLLYNINIIHIGEMISVDRFLSGLRARLAENIPGKAMRALRPFLTVQFFIFMGMGIVNTAVSVVTATLLDIFHRVFLPADNSVRIMAEQTRLNFIIGYAVSIVVSFFLNSRFTFHQKPTWKRFIKFPISYIPNFVFQYLAVFIFTAFERNTTTAYILAAIIGTPLTFAAMKLMVFRRKKIT